MTPLNAAEIVVGWVSNPHAIHKRPPYKAHSFDADDRFWVVGSTGVSVLQGWHGPQEIAAKIADQLNVAASLSDRG